MNSSRNPATRPMVAIPRNPTIEDARAFMEFLAQERPQLYEALETVEQDYRARSRGLSSEKRVPDESDGA